VTSATTRGDLAELLLAMIGRPATVLPPAQPDGLAHHAQCVALSKRFRGSLCDQLGRGPGRSVRAGEFLYHMGESARSVYLVRSGLIKTGVVSPGGQELTLEIHQPGDVFGELCLCGGERRDHAVALEESDVVEIPLDRLIGRLREDPAAALDFAASACEHLQHAYERLRSLSVESAIGRLSRALLELAASLGEPSPEGIRIRHHLTQEELGRLIGARREVVSGLLNQLRDAGLISYGRREFIAVNRKGLEELLDSLGQS
jgi:CRP/FNR family transcriptional regulator, cyclic AMP receptor protein